MSAKQIPLRLKKLTKFYGKDRGIEDITLDIEPGEVFGFLGPNGAGKSTTIRTILNFISPTSGQAQVFGLDSVHDSVELKNHIGYLAGDIALYDRMTGQQTLEYMTSLGKRTDWDYVKELTKRLDVTLNRPIKKLSKGNKQKIGLLQAFMHKPELIILDEPTSGLDPLMQQIFYDMVKEISAKGKTIFVSSHNLTEVQKICDRAAFIRDGHLVAIEKINTGSDIKFHRYSIVFDDQPDEKALSAIKGVTKVVVNDHVAELTLNGSADPLIQYLAKNKVDSLDELELALEEMFMHYYQEGK